MLSILLIAVSLIVPLAVLAASRLTAVRIRTRAARDSSSAAMAGRTAASREPTPATSPTTMRRTHR
jgi:hypothetical protein